MDELDPCSHTKSCLNMLFYPKRMLKSIFKKKIFLPSPPTSGFKGERTKAKMHSWGCATWDGVCANASFSQAKKLKTGAIIFDVVENSCWLRGAGGS